MAAPEKKLTSETREKFKKALGLKFKKKKYLLAVSGGVDSIVLLSVLKSIVPIENLVVAHVNHRARKNSDRDEQKLKANVGKLKISFVSIQLNPARLDENTLRDLRWKFLQEQRLAFKCDYIVTGHHLEDQLETFFQRLIRGSSFLALSGMKPLDGVIFRPFLQVPKTVLVDFALREKIEVLEDETNREAHYFRNEIRLNLLPALYEISDRFGGKESFLKRFERLRSEIEVWNNVQRKKADKIGLRLRITPYWSVIDSRVLRKVKGLSRITLLQTLFKKMGVSFEIKHLQVLARSLEKKNFKLELPQRVQVRESFGMVYFLTVAQSEALAKLRLTRFKFKLVRPLTKQEEFRFFKPGDEYQGKKLKEWFQELKIPFFQRSSLPVIAKKKSSKISWFLGIPTAVVQVIENPFEN